MEKKLKGIIESCEWGSYLIRGEIHNEYGEGVGKDIRLIGQEVSKWAERKGHLLTLDMITGVLGKQIEVLIIGNGHDQKLVCPENVINEIRRHGIQDVRVMPTPKACEMYNQIYAEGIKVALLAHGTC